MNFGFPTEFWLAKLKKVGSGGNSPEAELALTLWEERSKGGGMSRMFDGCTSLTTVPLFDTSKQTSFTNMFNGCTSITTVPLFNMSEAKDLTSMFNDCYSLTTVPLFNTSKVTSFMNMFSCCTSLTTVPLFNTSKGTSFGYMFNGCTSLTTVPPFDMSNSTFFTDMFRSCTSLTDCYLRNIKTSLKVGSGSDYGHLLTVDSLTHLIYELRDTGSRKTLTMGSVNLAKLADVYVRTIDITDEMRTEDDLIDEKLPFEVCESTDERAVLITSYVLEKNWTLA